MKKLLILLAVATLPAASGCACARLCPCCPCNWFARPAAVCAPACPPTYAAPLAAPCAPYSPCAPVATAAPYMPAMAQPFAPQCATCQNQPMMAQPQPMYYQAPMNYQMPMNAGACGTCYAEPGCAYAGEVGCGCSGPAMVGYGGDCGSCGSCGSCDSCGGGGCSSCGSGGPAVASPTPVGAPDRFVDPAPGA
jgi:hypothetical protein